MIAELIAFVIGLGIVVSTLYSAIRSLVLPRAAPDPLTSLVFYTYRVLFRLISLRARTYKSRDRLMAYLAPLAELTLVPVWFTLITFGFMCIYWALGHGTWYESFRLSGSSLLTLGFSTSNVPLVSVFIFSEATIGLMMVALLIAYLPTIYAAFSRREVAVTMLEVRAGNPPSPVELILRFQRIHGLDRLTEQWQMWEKWFADIQESHTSFTALVFLRSPNPEHSWINAAGTVLDAASLTLSTIDYPNDPQAALCIRAGYLALKNIADYFGIPNIHNPQYPRDPISVTREEFDEACVLLTNAGIRLNEDLEQAYQDFAGWRVNYDTVLLEIADLIMVPNARWIGNQPG